MNKTILASALLVSGFAIADDTTVQDMSDPMAVYNSGGGLAYRITDFI
ncbi:hypothetical protein L4D20_12365 [Vibrio kyushuensis]